MVLNQLKKTSYLLPYEYASNKSGAVITSADALKSNTFTDLKRVFNSRLKKLIEKGITQGKDIFFLINNKKLSHDEIKSQLIRFLNNRTSENKEGTYLFFSEKNFVCYSFESDKNGFITELPEYDLKEIRAAISSKPLTPSRESEKTSDSLASNLNITQEKSDVNELFSSLLLRGEITLLERKKDIENRNERYLDAVTSLEKLTPLIQLDSIKESNNKFVKKQKESRFYKDVQNLFVKTKTSNKPQENKKENTSSENISYENEEMSKAAAIKERNQQKKLTTQMILDQEDKEQMENISAAMKSATKDFMDLNATPITEEKTMKSTENFESQEYWKNQFQQDNAETFKAIDDYLEKGIRPKGEIFSFFKSPEILKFSEISENTIQFSTKVINKARNTHNLTNEEIKSALINIASPVLIFDSDINSSENKENSVLLIANSMASSNKPLAITLNMNVNAEIGRKEIIINEIRSIHDRTLIAKNGTDLIQKWTENGLCRYVDDKKISEWSKAAGVQFPIAVLQSDKTNILSESNIVNGKKISEWQLAAGEQFPLAVLHSDRNNILSESDFVNDKKISNLVKEREDSFLLPLAKLDKHNVTLTSEIVNGTDYPEIRTFSKFAEQQKAMEKEYQEYLGTISPDEESSRRIDSGEIFGKLENQQSKEKASSLSKNYAKLVIDSNQAARIKAAREIKENMPSLSENERTAAIAILEAGAKSQGMEFSEYVEKTFPDGIFGDIKNAENAAKQQGVKINGAVSVNGFGENVKAVIYAGKNADFSTWCHELSHIWQAQLAGELKNDAEEAFQVKDSDWQNSIYTFKDGHTDTSAEAFAYGFEDFLKHKAGEMATEDKKAIFEKFADYMSRTYNGVKQHIEINEKIASVYQKFVELDDNILAQAEKAVRLEIEQEQKINEIFNSPNFKTSQKVSETIGLVSDKFAALASQYRYDIKGYSHTIDNFFVNHALKQHGDKETEEKRGNVAITYSDICNVFSVYTHPDYIVFGTKTKTGNPAIVYVKNIGDSTIFVEDVRRGKKELATQTLYKKSGTIDVSSKKEAPELYAHSDPESISIVDVKKEFVNESKNEFLQREKKIAQVESFQTHSPGNQNNSTDAKNANISFQPVDDSYTLFQSAYHGSSANFDKFNTSEYGLSGDGAMAFGYGVYVSNSETIARSYAGIQGERNLYTVEIPDGDYIIWNKTVSKLQKEKVKNELYENLIKEDYKGVEKQISTELNNVFSEEFDGKKLYGTISSYIGSDKETSRFFKNIGYSGIQYPAGTPENAVNYVIFDDNDIKIKNHFQFQIIGELGARELDRNAESNERSVALKADRQENKMENTSTENISYENEEMSKAAAIKERNQQKKLTTQMILDQEDKEQMESISATMKSATKDFMDLNATPITEERIDFLKTPTGNKSELSENEWKFSHSSEFKKLYGDWEGKIKKDFLLNDDTVSKLTGDEFSRKEGFSLTEQVEQYFNEMNNSVESPFFGKVVLDREGADDSLSHGMGRLKAVAYAGVPNVIKNGVIIDSDLNHKDRGYNSYVIAAPIKIADKNYICEVVLKQNKQENRFYLHEVTEQKKFLERAFVTNPAQKPAHQGTLSNILEKTVSVNYEISCPMGINGEPEKTFVQNEYRKSLDEFQSKNQNTAAKITDSVSQEENPFKNADPDQTKELYEQAEAVEKMQQEAAANAVLDENGNTHYQTDEELLQEYKQKYPESSLSISEDTRNELENVFSQIDDYLDKGIVPQERRFTLPKVSSYLKQLGSDETAISLPVSVIKKARETHGLSNEEIKNSLTRLYDPVAVFDTDKTKSENKLDSKLILTDEFSESKPIALALNTNTQIQVEENGHRKFIEVQDIRSIHDRTLTAKNGTDLVKHWTENGLCRYVDDKKISEWSTVARVSFPIEALHSDKNNILTKSEVVNPQNSGSVKQEEERTMKSTENFESQEYWKNQFKQENADTFKAIDDYLEKGIRPKNDEFIFEKVPEILKAANVSENEIVIKTSIINKAKNEHSISDEEIKDSIKNIASPVLVFNSDKTTTENKKESFLCLTDTFAENGKPIAFSMNLDSDYEKSRSILNVNQITSIHDRTLIAKNGTDLIQKWTENGLCRYVDDKKISEWQLAARVQFPLAVLHSDINNINLSPEIVNGTDYQEIQTFSEFAEQQKAMEKEYQEYLGTISPDEESSRRIDSGEIFGKLENQQSKEKASSLSKNYTKVAVGVAPTIQTLRTSASSTALRASTTLATEENISQVAEKSINEQKIKMPDQLVYAAAKVGQVIEQRVQNELGIVNPTRDDRLSTISVPLNKDYNEDFSLSTEKNMSETQKSINEQKTKLQIIEQEDKEQLAAIVMTARKTIKESLAQNAEPLVEVDFSKANYDRLFPRAIVQTPVETVKLGENQFEKLDARDRKRFLLATFQTLATPDLVIDEEREGKHSHNYIKSFVFDEKTKTIQDVVVNINGENVSITAHPRDINNIVNKIKMPDQLVYAAARVGQVIEQRTQEAQSIVNPTRDDRLSTISVPLNKGYNENFALSTVEKLLETEKNAQKATASDFQQIEPALQKKFDKLKAAIKSREEQDIQDISAAEEPGNKKQAIRSKSDIIRQAGKDFLKSVKEGIAPFFNAEDDFQRIIMHPQAIINASNGLPFSGESQLLAQIYHQRQRMEGEVVTSIAGAKAAGTIVLDTPESRQKNFALTDTSSLAEKNAIVRTRYFMPESCEEPDKIYAHTLQRQRPDKIRSYRDLIRHFENIPNGQKEISDIRIRIAHEHLKEIQSRFAIKEKRVLSVDEIEERKNFLRNYFERLPADYLNSERSAFEDTFGIQLNSEKNLEINLQRDFKDIDFAELKKNTKKSIELENRKLSDFIEKNTMEDKKLATLLSDEYKSLSKEEKMTVRNLKIEAIGIKEPETFLGKYLAACNTNAEFITDKETVEEVKKNLVKKLEENFKLEKYDILKEIGQQAQSIGNETTKKISFEKAHSNNKSLEKTQSPDKEISLIGMGK